MPTDLNVQNMYFLQELFVFLWETSLFTSDVFLLFKFVTSQTK